MSNLSRKERERLVRETEIINAAEKIFARDGYENASMNEIAKEAEFSKRTLYQYFEDKSDLYLTVALRIYKSMIDYFHSIEIDENINGYETIKIRLLTFYDFYKENEIIFRIIYDIGKVRQNTRNTKFKDFLEIDKIISSELRQSIIKGQKDGSISKSLDPPLTASALIFIMTGFLNQLTISGNSYSKHIQVDMDVFSAYVINLLHSTLK